MGIKLTGGQWCGRILSVPKGDKVRPTTGRVRESVLQKIAPYLSQAHVLDGFAGSGLMGFECLSRGAASVVAVEQSPHHAKVIAANAALLGVASPCYQLKVMPLQRYLAKPLFADCPPCTVVYLDPPYAFSEWPVLLSQLKTHNHGQWPEVCLCEVAGDADPNTLLGEPWAKQLKARWAYGDTQVWWL
jgi:16S rRNA (guanine966-N2)-methyltransferase